MPRVVHFEIPIDEPERAIEFYNKVFDWKIEKWDGPQEYWVIYTGDKEQVGIDGGFMRRADPYSTVTNSIEVSSVDEYLEKVAQGGGQTVTPKITLPGVGFIAYCQDTEGNLFSLYQKDHSAQA